MTFDEAMQVVDAGGIVARESQWELTQAGFSWGPWVSLKRRFTDEDIERDLQRCEVGDWTAPSIEPSGSQYRAVHTLCESIELGDLPPSDEWCTATDWMDVTNRFEHGAPKGYFESMHRNSEAQGVERE